MEVPWAMTKERIEGLKQEARGADIEEDWIMMDIDDNWRENTILCGNARQSREAGWKFW
jgi:hypothetical protein